MLHLFFWISILLAGSVNANNETAQCQSFYLGNSDKPYEICFYDFGKENRKVIISKECILKRCEAYKAYEKALTIINNQSPGDMDHDWGVINCINLKGTITYLSSNRQRSGEMRFCKFSDYSFVMDGFLDTSRSNG